MTKSQIHTKLVALKETMKTFDPSKDSKDFYIQYLQNIISSLEK